LGFITQNHCVAGWLSVGGASPAASRNLPTCPNVVLALERQPTSKDSQSVKGLLSPTGTIGRVAVEVGVVVSLQLTASSFLFSPRFLLHPLPFTTHLPWPLLVHKTRPLAQRQSLIMIKTLKGAHPEALLPNQTESAASAESAESANASAKITGTTVPTPLRSS